MMLAAESYCECCLFIHCCLKTVLIFPTVCEYLLSCAHKYLVEKRVVYKLVRFYQPSSRDQYGTTRATLTIFSTYYCGGRVLDT